LTHELPEAAMIGLTHTTRECTLGELDAGLLQAIRTWFQAQGLGDPETEVRMCCETLASRQNTNRLAEFLNGRSDSTVHLGILLTKDTLIWARHGDVTGTVVNGTRLGGLHLKVLITRKTNNMQLEVTGKIVGSKDFVRGNLELGPEPAAQKFCQEVELAVKEINPPPKKGRLKWFGA
jgi:hypothetical protein